MTAKTLFEKVWEQHQVVAETPETPAVLYIDLHLLHEVTSPQAFEVLRSQGLPVRHPQRVLATMDHSTPTDLDELSGRIPFKIPAGAQQIRQFERNCREFGLELYGLDSPRRGIVHVIGPELGATQPGKTIVCGDSHTATHGAFGALAFGIGTTEVGHVLATQCLLQRRPKTLSIEVDGQLPAGVDAKDLILAIIGEIGVSGGTGHVIEYRGPAIESLSMEARMTVCNMSIEAGARAGMIAPDDTTFDYLQGRPWAPQGADWERAVEHWRTLRTDPGARFDRVVRINASALQPMISYGTHPGMVMPLTGAVPALSADPVNEKALNYMGLQRGEKLLGKPIQVVFIGSCTNGRLSDLQAAAEVMKGRRVADTVRALVVPGSHVVKREAEALGLDRIFIDAGAQWREPGCSMCIGMNGDIAAPGQYAVSTSNRNFEGRQGTGSRTLLASPVTAAAAAVCGHLADPRSL